MNPKFSTLASFSLDYPSHQPKILAAGFKITIVAFSCILILRLNWTVIIISRYRSQSQSQHAHQEREVDNKGSQQVTKDQQILAQLVNQLGMKKWAEIARIMHRTYSTHQWTGKQCNQRWNNHLRADLTRNQWTQEDDILLMQLRVKEGNRWVQIARSFPGKSVNNVKNRFYALGRRSFRRMCKFTGTIAKNLNAQSVKPATFSKIFAPHSISPFSSFSTPNNEIFTFEELQNISSVLIQFMDDKGKNQVLKERFNINQIKRIIERIFELNDFYNRSAHLKEGKKRKMNHRDHENDDEGSDLQLQGGISNQQRPQSLQKIQNKVIAQKNIKNNSPTSPSITEDFALMQHEDIFDDRDWNQSCRPIQEIEGDNEWAFGGERPEKEVVRDLMEYGLEEYMFIEYDTTPIIRILDQKMGVPSPLGIFDVHQQ